MALNRGKPSTSQRGYDLPVWLDRHLRVAFQAADRLLHQPVASIMTAMVIGIALSLPAGLYVMLSNLQQLSGSWDDAASISAFLRPEVTDEAASELARNLRESRIELTRQRAKASSILRLRNHSINRRVLSVDGNGKVVEYELHETIGFDLIQPTGKLLVPAQQVSVVRAYINTEEQVLGKQQEEEMLRQDMQRDLVDQLLRRLQNQLK